MTEENNEPAKEAEVSKEDSEIEAAFSTADQPKHVMMTDVELKNLQKESMDYKDKYLRSLAESENVRKRMQKERKEQAQFAMEGVIVDFLHPLDNLENALRFAEQASDEVRNWAIGFQMIMIQFKDVLSSNGVIPIESLGKPFDPHQHEAVEMIETDEQKPGVIIEECIRGYKMGERTIRPARVKVSKAKEQIQSEELLNN